MINQVTRMSLLRATRCARPIALQSTYSVRQFSGATVCQKTITDNIKEKAETLNQKAGDIGVDIIDKTENAAYKVKETAESLTGKSGEKAKQNARTYAADARDVAEDAKYKAKDLADDAKYKAQDLAEDAEGTFKNIKHQAKGKAYKAKDAAEDVANNVDGHVRKVKKNHSGYDSLQDKGRKVETEQNRPDDGL